MYLFFFFLKLKNNWIRLHGPFSLFSAVTCLCFLCIYVMIPPSAPPGSGSSPWRTMPSLFAVTHNAVLGDPHVTSVPPASAKGQMKQRFNTEIKFVLWTWWPERRSAISQLPNKCNDTGHPAGRGGGQGKGALCHFTSNGGIYRVMVKHFYSKILIMGSAIQR